MPLYRVESGEPAVTIGTVIKGMRLKGLAGEVALLARDDKAGRHMQDEQLPRRRLMRAGAQRELGPTRRATTQPFAGASGFAQLYGRGGDER